jgi:hypothetical protein
MKKILLDTNFLLVPIQLRLDIFSEIYNICDFKHKLFILDKTIEELKNIAEKQRGKNKEAAKFALKLIKLKGIGIIKATEKSKKSTADELMLKKANKNEFIVATQDKNLKKQLKAKGIPVIIVRQKKRLVLEGKI